MYDARRMPLQEKIEQHTALIGVMALGYVGLPLIRDFCNAGFSVLGFDTDPHKIELLQRGENYLKHLGEDFVADMLASGRFDVTTDLQRLGEPDAILICVPTPLAENHQPDLQYVDRAADSIARCLRHDQLIVLVSTTYPGTTRQRVLPRLMATGLRLGRDFFLAYCPERQDPGRQQPTTRQVPRLIGATDEKSAELAADLYRHVVDCVVPVDSAEIAEAAKLLENVYRAVNIALVNEMKLILAAMDIDVWKVIDAAATKPYGFQPFYPGPGLGGHCIPIDPFYLAWKARQASQPTHFIELAGQINTRMPEYVVQCTRQALAQRGTKMDHARILVLGLAYKPNVDDVRESPSFELIARLRALGATVDYHDPLVRSTPKTRRYDLDMTSVPLNTESLGSYDCVLIATAHDSYDFQMIAEHAQLVVDTRGATRQTRVPPDRIVYA